MISVPQKYLFWGYLKWQQIKQCFRFWTEVLHQIFGDWKVQSEMFQSKKKNGLNIFLPFSAWIKKTFYGVKTHWLPDKEALLSVKKVMLTEQKVCMTLSNGGIIFIGVAFGDQSQVSFFSMKMRNFSWRCGSCAELQHSREYKLQSLYFIHFQTYSLGKSITPPPPVLYPFHQRVAWSFFC